MGIKEHEIIDIITYNYRGDNIKLKLTEVKDLSCNGCFFYDKKCDYLKCIDNSMKSGKHFIFEEYKRFKYD